MSGSYSNIAYNCLEQNIKKGFGQKIAFYWEGNDSNDVQNISYMELLNFVSKFASTLQNKGIRKRDVVLLYLPMVIELPVAMLACARIGAIHCVVFAGFSADALAVRILQTEAKLIVTADGFFRGNKLIYLKTIADEAIELCNKKSHFVKNCIVLEHLRRVTVPSSEFVLPKLILNEIDSLWDKEMNLATESSVVWCEAEDPLFILHSSGSTGSPKGLVHTTIGYMIYAYFTTNICFDIKPDDILWCTADCGWITGHTTTIYGSLLNGVSSVIFEGSPIYPDATKTLEIIEKYKITKFYTAPTLIRSLMSCSEEKIIKYDRSSLKILATAGEPINPNATEWMYNTLGDKQCVVIDTYWQTETGGIIIGPAPGVIPTVAGSATVPFFGIIPVILNDYGQIVDKTKHGNLCIKQAWPGLARTIWKDHKRFVNTYFSKFPGYYFTGDGCFCDADTYFWINGRVDDFIKVSGRLLSTSEIESALLLHQNIIEAAVVGISHPIKGQIPYGYVTLKKGKNLNSQTIHILKQIVREKIGSFAVPDDIRSVSNLPKTRSSKIVRRILRIIAENSDSSMDFGDISTLVDQDVISDLLNENNLFQI